MLEKELQRAVIELAHLYGWLVFHPRPSQNSRGDWRTYMSGDRGFPDLTLVHTTGGICFVELKSTKGRLSPEQKMWLEKLSLHADAMVWRPADWMDGTIERYLLGAG